MDSHVQMPKLVLRHFANEHGGLYYYDCESKRIKRSGAGKINVIRDYYSDGVEDILNRTIERLFGKVIEVIETIDYEHPNVLFSKEQEKTIREYARALIVRSPKQHKDISDETVFFSELPSQQQHDMATLFGLKYMEDQRFFNNMISTVMVNRTTTPFVLPMIGMYEVSINGERLIIMPVTSKHAILLFSKELSDKVITSNGKILFHLVDEERAKEFNFHAMETEIATNKVAVASGEKKVLEEISAEACTFNLESKINDTNK